MYRIDLNCDAGESFGQYTLGSDAELFKHVTSANIACGYHAGDHNVISQTVKLASEQSIGDWCSSWFSRFGWLWSP